MFLLAFRTGNNFSTLWMDIGYKADFFLLLEPEGRVPGAVLGLLSLLVMLGATASFGLHLLGVL